jgi:hypothetical protein
VLCYLVHKANPCQFDSSRRARVNITFCFSQGKSFRNTGATCRLTSRKADKYQFCIPKRAFPARIRFRTTLAIPFPIWPLSDSIYVLSLVLFASLVGCFNREIGTVLWCYERGGQGWFGCGILCLIVSVRCELLAQAINPVVNSIPQSLFLLAR